MAKDIYRFNAYNRNYDDVPQEIRPISSYDPECGTFEQLKKSDIEGKRIVVSTCINAGQLYSMSCTPFTHILVDEAGQAMEPECLVALTALATANTTVVIAGDPKQLGPVIRSPFAMQDGQGLGRSLLERLISTAPYRRDPVNYAAYGNYNVRLITKLVNNYRSHPEILSTPNAMFYDNELVPMADIVRRTALCNWEGLPTKGFPLVFHGMEGKDEREGNSPSWFNISECLQVFEYIKQLRALRSPQVAANEIGVITPYRKQAEKIRVYLRAQHMEGVTVGSVEQFQGQERLLIIVSCVRSNSEHLEFDYKHNLGFLKNPKRFNVAITRPQALLIVIGNPRVLVHDPHWARLLWHIVDHGGYRGCDLPPRIPTDSMEQIIDVFDRLRVGGEENVDDDTVEHPEWHQLN
jgi:superfamily I DNA and/or RNA helicase